MGAVVMDVATERTWVTAIAETPLIGGMLLFAFSIFPGIVAFIGYTIWGVGVRNVVRTFWIEGQMASLIVRMIAGTYLVAAIWCAVLWYALGVRIRFFWMPTPFAYVGCAALLIGYDLVSRAFA